MKSHRPFATMLVLALAFISCKEEEDPVAPCVGGIRTASVSIAPGSSQLGCQTTSRCYIPFQAKVGRGGQVTWSNDDNGTHSVTSGTPQVPDGKFSSGLLPAGQSFSVTITDTGTIKYHCQVHPWMLGEVRVEGQVCP